VTRLIALCLATLVGIAVGDVSRLEPARLGFAALLALLGALLAHRQPAWRLAALIACAVALGGLRASLVDDEPAAALLEPYYGLAVRARGVVLEPPVLTSSGASARMAFEIDGLAPAGRDPPPGPLGTPSKSGDGPPSLAARVRVIGPATLLEEVAAGDRWLLEGRLLSGEGHGQATLLFPRLVRRDMPLGEAAVTPMDMLANLRTAAGGAIRRYLPEPQGSLAVGVLLGGSGGLDAEFRMQLQRSGLAHLMAIDGYKQVVVAGALGAFSVRLLGARLAAVPILFGITGYTLLTGAHPSAIRAALMVGLATLASLTGRVADSLTSLLLAAVVMALVEPRILLDIGLQLSLSATLGLILLWPSLRRWVHGIPRWVAEPAGLTVAVTLSTLPVVLSVFQLVSLVSPVAHILAAPLLPLVLAGTALLALVSPFEAVATPVGWFAWLPCTVLAGVIQLTGNLPGAALSTGRLPTFAAWAMTAGLVAWGVWGLPEAAVIRNRLARHLLQTRVQTRVGAPVACLVGALGATLVLQLIRPDGQLHVHPLEAGRGQAVLVRGPTGRTALVAGGRVDAAALASAVADHLAVWEHKLDAVLALDARAAYGLGPTLARYPPDQLLDPAADTRFDLGGGAVLDIYAADRQPIGVAVSISFGADWWPIVGRPPPPLR
jgi:competence protein ComEC